MLYQRTKYTIIGAAASACTIWGVHRLVDSETTFSTLTTPPEIEELNLSPQQLKKDLGIGNKMPFFSTDLLRTYDAWQGWVGPAKYDFRARYLITPYLESKQQLNNWNYVLYGDQRLARESKMEEAPVSPDIKIAVDRIKNGPISVKPQPKSKMNYREFLRRQQKK